MMRDNNGPGRVVPRQFALQPSNRFPVNCDGIARLENAIRAAESNKSVVIYEPLRLRHGLLWIGSQRKIRPERASQKREATQLNRAVFQQVGVAALRLAPRRLAKLLRE